MGDIGENEAKRGKSPLPVVLGFLFRFTWGLRLPRPVTFGRGGGGIIESVRRVIRSSGGHIDRPMRYKWSNTKHDEMRAVKKVFRSSPPSLSYVLLLPLHLFWMPDYTYRYMYGLINRGYSGGRPEPELFALLLEHPLFLLGGSPSFYRGVASAVLVPR